MVAGQIHRHGVVGNNLRDLNILGQIDEHRAGTAGGGNVERLTHHAGNVGGVGDEVVVLGDTTADLDNRRLLEGIGANHAGSHLSCQGDEGNAIHLGVGDGRHQIQGTGSAGGHAHPRPPGGAGIALGCKSPPLLVARQDRADPILVAGEGLMQRHAGPARIGKDHIHAMGNQRFHYNVGPGNEGFGGAGT